MEIDYRAQEALDDLVSRGALEKRVITRSYTAYGDTHVYQTVQYVSPEVVVRDTERGIDG